MPPLDVVGSLAMHGGGAEPEAACGCATALSTDDCDPYAPAESHRLRIGEDIDWSDVVGAVAAAAVLERDDSTKGAAANPKCAARKSAATAARSSLSAPAPRAVAVVIGGLPPGKAARDHGHGRRRSPCQLQLGGAARVFASGEAAGQQAEPGSPKVSCLGGVRSQPRTAAEGIASGRRWWAWLLADVMFCCCCCKGCRHRRPRGDRARATEAE